MDNDVDHTDIISLGKFMINSNINDSRDIDQDTVNNIITDQDIADDIMNGNMTMYLPDVVSEIRPLTRPLLCGGGRHECLAEVELIFKMLDKRYWKHEQFIY
jgi:hypothetical protein